MSYSLARAGASVVYVTDNLPMFDTDFAEFDRTYAIEKVVSKTFAAPDVGALDWIIVIPSGGVSDVVYDAAALCAAASGARIALLSFETPNWFNALSPYKRSGLSWEAWRRCVARGGFVITIAKEGIGPAREFYASPNHGALVDFAFWHPPINDFAADGIAAAAERQRVVVFTRTQDPHKGAADLLRIDPEVLDGRILSIVFGRAVDEAYLLALRRHFSRPGNTIEIHERITDAEKFQLLARSRLLLFPSYFEGFGYPVVEAAYMGVPSVAYDLPVLRETIGDAARYVPPGDHDAFSQAIVSALRTDPGPDIRARMRIDADTLSAGNKLLYLLDNYRASIKPHKGAPAPRAVKVPQRREILATPLMQAEWTSVAQPIRFRDLRAVLTPSVLTVTGSVKAESPDAVLTVQMAGAQVAPLTVEGGSDNANASFRAFAMRGSIGPVLESGSFCTVKLSEKGKPVVTRTLPVTMAPELLCLAEMWACSGEVGAASGLEERIVIVADLNRLLAVDEDTLALSELAARFRSSGFRVRMVLIKGRAATPSPDDLDLLPIADSIDVLASADDLDDHLSALAECCATTFVAATDLVADPPGRPVLAIAFDPALAPIVLSRTALDGKSLDDNTLAEETPPAQIRYIPSLAAASRSERQRARRRLIVVGGCGQEAADAASRCIREVFPGLAKRIGAVRFLVHKPLAGRIEDRTQLATHAIDRKWPIEVASVVDILKAAQGAGRTVILDLGERRTHALSAIGTHLGVPVLALSDEHDAEEIVRYLAPPAAATDRSSLAEAVAHHWPSSDGLLIGKLGAARAPLLEGLAWSGAKPTPPSLAVGQTIGFAAQSGDSNAFLVGGWAERGINGSAIAATGAMIAFTLPSLPFQTVTLEILMRSAAPAKTPLSCLVTLNEIVLGSLVLERSGSKSFLFAIPAHVWRLDEPQTLILKPEAVKVEQAVHTPILTALALTAPAVQMDWSSFDPGLEPKDITPVQDLPAGGKWHFGMGGNGFSSLGRGWSNPEPEFTWSDGAAAGIVFDRENASASPMLMVIEADAFVSPTQPVQRASVHAGDACLGEIRTDARWNGRFAFGVPATLARDGFDSLLFAFPDTLSPREMDGSADHRRLALALRTIAIVPTAGPPLIGVSRTLGVHGAGTRIEFGGLEHSAGILRLAGSGGARGRIVLGTADGPVATRPIPTADGWEAWIGLTDLAADGVTLVAVPGTGDGPPLRPEKAEFWPVGGKTGAPRHLVVLHQAQPSTLNATSLPAAWLFGMHDGRDILGAGWSRLENTYFWSEARYAEIQFRQAAEASHVVARLDVMPFLAPGLERQRIIVSDGAGLSWLVWLSRSEQTPLRLALPGRTVPALTLHFPDAASPVSLGVSTDPRLLGVQIHRVHLDQVAGSGDLIERATFAIDGWQVSGSAETADAIVIELTGPVGSGIGLLGIAGSNVYVAAQVTDGREVLTLAGPRSAEMVRIVECIEESNDHPTGEGRVVAELQWRIHRPDRQNTAADPELVER